MCGLHSWIPYSILLSMIPGICKTGRIVISLNSCTDPTNSLEEVLSIEPSFVVSSWNILLMFFLFFLSLK
jgi:hypothetical protein